MAHIGRSKNRYPHHHSLLDPVSRLLQWQHTRLKRLCATSESTDRPQSSLWVGIQYSAAKSDVISENQRGFQNSILSPFLVMWIYQSQSQSRQQYVGRCP